MAARPPEVCDTGGRTISLGESLGQGGEGVVYDVRSSPDTVAKIYHQPLSVERANKIRLMVSLRSDDIARFTAWPLNLLSTKNGQRPIGLTMPKVSGRKDIHRLYSVKSRRADFQRVDWRFLIRAAGNTARAFGIVHQMGCVIGDVNHSSILVGQDATVKLIDCDSFQVTAGGQRYLCEVGVDTFTPPELQGRSFKGIVRTADNDNFGLAVMIFLTLFMGRHPFAGLYSGGDMPIAKAIAEHRFAYGSKSKLFGMSKPPGAATLDIAGPEVSLLFERAFARECVGTRPTARDWVEALSRLENELKQCAGNPSHWHRKDLGCPWCPIEGATGTALFSMVVQTSAGTTFEIETLWRQALAIPNPGPAPNLAPPIVEPSEAAQAARRAHGSSELFRWGAALLLVGVSFFGDLPSPAPGWLFVAGVAAYFLVPVLIKKDDEVAQYRSTLQSAKNAWAQAQQEWNAKAGPESFNQAKAKLAEHRRAWDGLAGIRLQKLESLKKNLHKLQLDRYLDGFEIERAQIEGFGRGRKQLLESYGIETAADVWQASSVPGIGPVLLSNLVNWRTSLEARFRFDPSKGVDPRDIAKVEQEILAERKRLEQLLRAGVAQLQQTTSQITNARKYMRPKIEELQKAYYQAHADATGKSP